jgi:hypothetical protein
MPKYSTFVARERGAVLVNKPSSLTERRNLIGFALDRSESMKPLTTVAVNGLNQLLEEQRSDSLFTLSLFNDNVSTIHDAVPICDVQPMRPGSISPERRDRSQRRCGSFDPFPGRTRTTAQERCFGGDLERRSGKQFKAQPGGHTGFVIRCLSCSVHFQMPNAF